MKINTFLFEVKNSISVRNQELIKEVVFKHATVAAQKLNIDFINIVIYPNHDLTIPKVGSGGFAPNSDWIRLAIDPRRKDEEVENIIKNIIPLSVYHEMNHVARWMKPGYGTSLMEVIISEGLAIVFAEENWNLFVAPWGKYTKNEIAKYLLVLKKRNRKKDKNYDHAEWFFGKGKPNWIGYKLGAYIIRKVRENCPKIGIEELVNMDAEKIIKLSGI